MQRTPLYAEQSLVGAQWVDFHDWQLPLHYGSQLQEHHAVRKNAGVFDVSHMTIVDLEGEDAKRWLSKLLANDVQKIQPGQALYSCLLNEAGGILDDLIVYQIESNRYRLVFNAATRDKVLAWLAKQRHSFAVNFQYNTDLVMLAIQGPETIKKTAPILKKQADLDVNNLAPFHLQYKHNWLVARTGYTGEDGIEVMLPNLMAINFWRELLATGIQPCGLGARDTLRLEAGLNLYGVDMDETTTPLESNLGWTVAWQDNRQFIGRTALEEQRKRGLKKKLVGLVLTERGVLRNHMQVNIKNQLGEITSGSFSPTLGQGIALARVPMIESATGLVTIHNKSLTVKIVKPPFVKHGKQVYK